MNEAVKEIIYNAHRSRMNQIVEKIDLCWNNEREAGMKFYIKYIQNFVEFIEGEKI